MIITMGQYHGYNHEYNYGYNHGYNQLSLGRIEVLTLCVAARAHFLSDFIDCVTTA